MADKDLTLLEKQAGKKAARTIQRNWKSILSTATVKQTGILLRSATARESMKFDALDSIVVTASPATWKQNYGFEGIKSNGTSMSMKPFNHFDKLFASSKNALEKLLKEVAEIRGTAVTTRIQDVIKMQWDETNI